MATSAPDVSVPGASLLPVGGGVVNDAAGLAVTPLEDAAKAALDATGLGGVSKFIGDITNGRVWASIGWLALGLMLMYLGVMLWVRKADSGGGSGGLGLADVAELAAA
jgi:hypothetical protein